MNNREFDDIIKKKLESLNTDGSEGAWDLFKEKWDSESSLNTDNVGLSSEDQDLDAKIKTDMQKLRIPFNSKHWIILKEKLELEALFKKKLFVAKSVELVILAFLVVGILNLWPIQNDIHHIQFYDVPMVESIPVDKESAEKFQAQEDARLSKQSTLNNQLYKSTKEIVQKAIASVESLTSNSSTAISSSTISKNEEADKPIELKKSQIESTNGSSVKFPFVESIWQISNGANMLDKPSQEGNDNSMALLEQKEITPLELPLRPTGNPEFVLADIVANKKDKTYVSFAVGPKMNLVNSPFDPVYKIDPYNVINTNFNVSLKVQQEIGPIEVYGGLGYTNTSYVPRLVDEIYEPLERQFSVASLENIEFETINIPVGVKYNMIDTKKYQLYATAGVDLNIIADSDFSIEDKPVGAGNVENPQPIPQPVPLPTNEVVNSNAKLSQKDFNKGIISGGSLKDNLYATASVGLGMHWKLSSKSGIFIEPKYSHFISSNGIGPNQDKVHGVSVDIGFRFELDN